ncbi:MAG: hypothetical protein AAF658_14015, partial [Myxococcota bacterium]
ELLEQRPQSWLSVAARAAIVNSVWHESAQRNAPAAVLDAAEVAHMRTRARQRVDELADELAVRQRQTDLWVEPSLEPTVVPSKELKDLTLHGQSMSPEDAASVLQRYESLPSLHWQTWSTQCHVRARVVAGELTLDGYAAAIVRIETVNPDDKLIADFDWHESALVLVDTPHGPTVRIIDPMVGPEPLDISTWKTRLSNGNEVRVAAHALQDEVDWLESYRNYRGLER